MNKSTRTNKVVARLTAIRADGSRTIVEVHSDASFHSFYRFFSQQGNRRSTKKLTRETNRNAGMPPMNAHAYEPGLEAIATMLRKFDGKPGNGSNVRKVTIRIIRRKMYRELLHAAPDALGMTKAPRFTDPRLLPRHIAGIPVHIPSTFTTTEKKWSILTGRS